MNNAGAARALWFAFADSIAIAGGIGMMLYWGSFLGGSMKRNSRRSVLLVLGLVLLPVICLAQQVSLSILHTNDTHSHLLPFSYPSVATPG